MYVLAQDIFGLMAYRLQTQLNLVRGGPRQALGLGTSLLNLNLKK